MNTCTAARRQLLQVSQRSWTAYPRTPRRILPFPSSPHASAAQRSLCTQHVPASSPRRPTFPSIRIAPRQPRYESSTSTSPLPSTTSNETPDDTEASSKTARKALEPAYNLTFTCRKCLHRSSHRVTKQAYHFGTTLITCPECKNRHLISDHLKIFSDKGVTIEDILREKGELLRKGVLGEDGEVEFYDEEATREVQKREEERIKEEAWRARKKEREGAKE